MSENEEITPRMKEFSEKWNRADSIESLCREMGLRKNTARTFCYRLRKQGLNLKPLSSAQVKKKHVAKKTPHFAANMTKLMERKELRDADVAAKLGVTPDVVGQWRRGRHEPAISYIISLASLFGVSTDALILFNGADAPVQMVPLYQDDTPYPYEGETEAV